MEEAVAFLQMCGHVSFRDLPLPEHLVMVDSAQCTAVTKLNSDKRMLLDELTLNPLI